MNGRRERRVEVKTIIPRKTILWFPPYFGAKGRGISSTGCSAQKGTLRFQKGEGEKRNHQKLRGAKKEIAVKANELKLERDKENEVVSKGEGEL